MTLRQKFSIINLFYKRFLVFIFDFYKNLYYTILNYTDNLKNCQYFRLSLGKAAFFHKELDEIAKCKKLTNLKIGEYNYHGLFTWYSM